nr:MAG TPA: hypothetical protein [Caudoviricetes sp.]
MSLYINSISNIEDSSFPFDSTRTPLLLWAFHR